MIPCTSLKKQTIDATLSIDRFYKDFSLEILTLVAENGKI